MSETATMTLTEFLLARIAEDERHARKLAENDRRPVLSLATTIDHPSRLLLECEAKRRIVEDEPARVAPDRRSQWERTLRTLATIYADHPDYDESWRP